MLGAVMNKLGNSEGRKAGGCMLLAAALFCITLLAAARVTAAQPDLGAAYAELERATAIVEGVKDDKAAKARLYVLFDANCLYCQMTWKAVQAYERIGLQVRWVPVAYQKDSSYGRAAAILGAPDPV